MTNPTNPTPDSARVIRAPWTPEQVATLNAYQKNDYVHPYTCGYDECRNVLVAATDGWHCSQDDYFQSWAGIELFTMAFIRNPLEERANDSTTPVAPEQELSAERIEAFCGEHRRCTSRLCEIQAEHYEAGFRELRDGESPTKWLEECPYQNPDWLSDLIEIAKAYRRDRDRLAEERDSAREHIIFLTNELNRIKGDLTI